MRNFLSKWRFPPGAMPALLLICAGGLLHPAPLHGQRDLPEAPSPQLDALASGAGSIPVNPRQQESPASSSTQPSGTTSPRAQGRPRPLQKTTEPGFPPVSPRPVARPSDAPRQDPEVPSAPPTCLENISTGVRPHMSCEPGQDPFQRFVDSAYIHPLTARQKGVLAFRNTIDPFNIGTIAVFSAIATASDPHSPYGPGLAGFGRNFGVASAETATDAFFGTFLIPSIFHQDPHYHRLPNASIARRVGHAITEVVWGVSDYGQGMPNYSTLLTTAIGGGIAQAYVPGIEQGFGPFAARYAISIATDPIDNFITEFLPDVARRVNIRVVLVQRVINQVAKTNGGAGAE